jgi:hypothetical protein
MLLIRLPNPAVNIVNPSIPSTRKHYTDIDEGNPSKKIQIDSQTDELHDNCNKIILFFINNEYSFSRLDISSLDSLSFMTMMMIFVIQ